MSTLTMTRIESGCCGGLFVAYGDDTDTVFCSDCMESVSVAADILPNMDEGESVTFDGHPSGVSVLGYVTREGE